MTVLVAYFDSPSIVSVTIHLMVEYEDGPDNMAAVKLASEVEEFVVSTVLTVIADTFPPIVLHTKLYEPVPPDTVHV